MEYHNNGVKGIPKCNLLLFVFVYMCVCISGDVVGQFSHVDQNKKDVAETRTDMSFIFLRVPRLTPTGVAASEGAARGGI